MPVTTLLLFVTLGVAGETPDVASLFRNIHAQPGAYARLCEMGYRTEATQVYAAKLLAMEVYENDQNMMSLYTALAAWGQEEGARLICARIRKGVANSNEDIVRKVYSLRAYGSMRMLKDAYDCALKDNPENGEQLISAHLGYLTGFYGSDVRGFVQLFKGYPQREIRESVASCLKLMNSKTG